MVIYFLPRRFPFLPLCPLKNTNPAHARPDGIYSLHPSNDITTAVEPDLLILSGICRKHYRLRWMERIWEWWPRSDSDCACSLSLSFTCKVPDPMDSSRLSTKVIFKSRIRTGAKRRLTRVKNHAVVFDFHVLAMDLRLLLDLRR